MLTIRVYSLGGKFFNILGYFGVIPFIWKPETQTLAISLKNCKKAYFLLCTYSLWGLYLFLQGIRYYRLGNIKQFNMCYVFCIAWSLASLDFAVFHWPNNGGLLAYNVVLQYSKYIGRYYTKRGHKSLRPKIFWMEFLITLSITTCTIGWILVNLFFIFRPQSPVFVGSIFVSHKKDYYFSATVLISCAHLWYIQISFHIFMMLACIQIFIIVTNATLVPFCLYELNVGKPKYKTVPSLRTSPRLTLAYRQIQLVLNILMAVFGMLLVPAQTLFTHLVLFVSFLLSEHRNKMGTTIQMVMVSWATISVCTWIFILELSGYVHKYGEEVLKSWKYHVWRTPLERRLMSKFRKSCKPIMVHYGRAYTIKRITVLKYTRGIIKGVFRTLLTLGKR